MQTRRSAKCRAPINLALIKYWGKSNVELNLPTNSSISVTLDKQDLCSTTTIFANPNSDTDCLVLNGKQTNIPDRMVQVVESLRSKRRQREIESNLEQISLEKLRIESENNFPTAAGLASSASGYAALVFALNRYFELNLPAKELSVYARLGSGSACRSLMGGFVAWNKGNDSQTSKAQQLSTRADWPEIKAIICVVDNQVKKVASTAGMQLTVATSPLFSARLALVDQRFEQMKQAISRRDFASLAELTMKDSNQFHAVCLDTWPPIFYLTDSSKKLIQIVQEINEKANSLICAYTFDAGANCVVLYQKKDESCVVEGLYAAIGNVPGWKDEMTRNICVSTNKLHVQRVICTQIGDSPDYVDSQ